MKNLGLGVFIVLALAFVLLVAGCKDTPDAAPTAGQQDGMQTVELIDGVWLTDLDQAFALAKQEGKPVIADFYADSCGACQLLDDETLSDPKVKQVLEENFVPVKLDMAKQYELGRKYQVFGLPTLMVFDSESSEVGRIRGFVEAGPLLEILEQLLEQPTGQDAQGEPEAESQTEQPEEATQE